MPYIENYGPLTTTFTPAPSCTATDKLSLALIDGNTTQVKFQVACPTWTSDFDCMPTGVIPWRVYDNAVLSGIGYYSPGLYCPSGWETVGTAASGDESLHMSGYFTAPQSKLRSNDLPVTAVTSWLGPNQTVALCCPSSMTPHPRGYCTALVPAYTPSFGCQVSVSSYSLERTTKTWVYDGITTTIPFSKKVYVKPTTLTLTTSFSRGNEPGFTAISIVSMITIVHHRSDVEAAAATSGTTRGYSTEAETETGTTSSGSVGAAASTSNPAYRLGSRPSSLDGFGVIVGGLAVAVALGVTMMIL